MKYKKQSNGNNDDPWNPDQVREQGPKEYNKAIEKAMEDHLDKIREIDTEDKEMERE